MRQVFGVLGILAVWVSIAGAESEFGDTRFRGKIWVWGATPTPYLFFDDGDGSVNSPGDISAVGDIISGGTITADDLIQMSGPFPDSQKVMRVQRTPTWTDTATPTNTFATPTPTHTPTGTWNTPTITPTYTATSTYTAAPTDEPYWLKGNGDMYTAGDFTIGGTFTGTIGDATVGDLVVDHLTIPGTDPTPAANEVMISVQANATPVFEVDAEGDVTAGAGTFSGAVSGTTGTFTGDITMDDGSGNSPLFKQVSEDDAYYSLAQVQGGWARLNHSENARGLEISDNLIVQQPTPRAITLDGGDLIVKDDSEYHGDMHGYTYIQIHGTPTPIITLGADGDLSVADDLGVSDDVTVGDDVVIGGGLTVGDSGDTVVLSYACDGFQAYQTTTPDWYYTTKDTPINGIAAIGAGTGATKEAYLSLPYAPGTVIKEIDVRYWWNASADADEILGYALVKEALSDGTCTDIARGSDNGGGGTGFDSATLSTDYTVESGYYVFVEIELYATTAANYLLFRGVSATLEERKY